MSRRGVKRRTAKLYFRLSLPCLSLTFLVIGGPGKSLKMIAFFVFEPWFRPTEDSETFSGYGGKRFKAAVRDSKTATRVKDAVRMRAFPASGANLHVPPPIEIIRDTKTN